MKAQYAILAVVAMVIVGFTAFLYSLVGAGALWALLLAVPFVMFGIGMAKPRRAYVPQRSFDELEEE